MKIGLVLALLGLCSSLWAGVTSWSNSGIQGPKYEKILEQLSALQAQYPERARVVDFGKSVQGKTLRMLVVGKKAVVGPRPAMVITGSIHGDEYLHIEDRLPGEFLTRSLLSGPVAKYIETGGVVLFVPIVNPDGYVAGRRVNSHGVDLNRDWDLPAVKYKGFKEPESAALAKVVETLRTELNLNYKVTVDYHCCAGAVLYPWSYTTAKLPQEDFERHLAIGESAKRNLKIEYGTSDDILGYMSEGTTKDYYYSRYGALAFTYEGRYGKEDQYFDKHIAWWEETLGLLQMEAAFSSAALPLKNRFYFSVAE